MRDDLRAWVEREYVVMVSLDYGDIDGVLGGAPGRSHPALHDRIAAVREHVDGVRAGRVLDVQRAIAEERARRRRKLWTAALGASAAAALLLVLRRR